MPASDRLFLQLEDGVAGPYTPAQLRELAEGAVVRTQTPAARSPEGPWQPLGDLPQAPEIFPPKTALGFKPKAFEDVNRGAPAVALTPVEKTEPVLALKSPSVPVDADAAAASIPDATAPPNNIREMVDEVAAIEARIAPPPPPPKRWRPSGRLQLIGTLALLGNGVVFAVPFFYDSTDVFSETILRGWLVIYNGGLVVAYVQLPKD